MKKNYKNNAFTLVELLVSMVISAMLLTMVLGSFWVLMQTNMQNEVAGRLQQQTNFALLRISDKVKNYSVDYAAYNPASPSDCKNLVLNTPQEMLCLGDDHTFKKNSDNLEMNGQPLFGPEFIVNKSLFWISPEQDPFENIGEKGLQLQPKVTTVLEVVSKEYPNISLNIQTTISSRKYRK